MKWLSSILALSSLALASPTDVELANRQSPSSSCVNSPTTRQCWTSGYDINTNYYTTWPTTGVTRKYYIKITNQTIAPDGVPVYGLVMNGQLPGPTIIGNWGDNFEVTIENAMPNNGTTIHWHGVRQLNTNQNDGIPGVVQCPIAPGTTYLYKFQATQYGSSWYHSHLSVQYAAGIQGGLIFHGPATANYDEDLGTMTIADWSHGGGCGSLFGQLICQADADIFPVLTQPLINGTNVYKDPKTNKTTGSYHVNTVTQNKKYRFRLINSSGQIAWRFTIDNHNMTVIANDFVATTPRNTDSVILTQGQRMDIIVTMNQPINNYWMRAIQVDNGFLGLEYQNGTGILRYAGASTTSNPTTSNRFMNTTTNAKDYNILETEVPYMKQNVGTAHIDRAVLVNTSQVFWVMNNSAMLVDWAYPTAGDMFAGANLTTFYKGKYVKWDDPSTPDRYDLPHIYNGTVLQSQNIWRVDEKNVWVYFVINNAGGRGEVHPIHLHGHDFWVLSQGSTFYDPAKYKLNLVNPPRRDVSNLLPGGHLVMAFYSDNPGLWLMHCHIAWHVSQGLALQWVERQSEIKPTYNLTQYNNTCNSWRSYTTHEVYGQDDAGVKMLQA